MNPRDDNCLRQAEYCRAMADRAESIDLKAEWLALAVHWLRIFEECGAPPRAILDAPAA